MDHYIDIRVLPDPEFSAPILMNALYAKLHRAIVAQGEGPIGVSFPEANDTPGMLLRIHSDRASLNDLMAQPWLKGLGDYTTVTPAQAVPADVRHVVVKRVQPKITAARVRRAVKRRSMSVEQAEAMLKDRELMKRPYFRLQSQSTRQSFPLFIEQTKPQDVATKGRFNGYGLSQEATVPWF